MFFIRTLAKYLMLPFGILWCFLNHKKNLPIILMYHRVNNYIYKELSIKEDIFEWQMNYLIKNGYHMLTMDEAVRAMEVGKVEPKSVVITFDDGYKDFRENAYPVLERYDIPTLMYLVPSYIDSHKTFWWDEDIGESHLLSWNDIIRLKQSDIITFGSHTCNHIDLNKLEEGDVREELEQSKKVLQERLAVSIDHFAYPRGIYSKVAEVTAQQYYTTSVLITKHAIDGGNTFNLHRLKRLPVQRSDGRYLFIARLKGWLVLEDWIRKRMD